MAKQALLTATNVLNSTLLNFNVWINERKYVLQKKITVKNIRACLTHFYIFLKK